MSVRDSLLHDRDLLLLLAALMIEALRKEGLDA